MKTKDIQIGEAYLLDRGWRGTERGVARGVIKVTKRYSYWDHKAIQFALPGGETFETIEYVKPSPGVRGATLVVVDVPRYSGNGSERIAIPPGQVKMTWAEHEENKAAAAEARERSNAEREARLAPLRAEWATYRDRLAALGVEIPDGGIGVPHAVLTEDGFQRLLDLAEAGAAYRDRDRKDT